MECSECGKTWQSLEDYVRFSHRTRDRISEFRREIIAK